MSAAADALGSRADDGAAYQCCWITDDAGFAALEGEWAALERAARVDHPFLSHTWLRTWWEHFGAGRQLRVLVVRGSDGTLAGAAPLMLADERVYGIPLRTLQSIAGDHTPRSGFLADHARADAVLDAMWSALRDSGDGWDAIVLRQLPDDSPTLRALEACAARTGLRSGRWPAGRSPHVRFAGAWNRYFDSLGYNHRRNIGKNRRRLEREGDVRLEVVDGGSGLGGHVADGMLIEASAWKAAAGTAMASEPKRRGFYATLAERFAAVGMLRLYFLRCGGRRIAFSFALVSDGVIYVLKAGYDPDYARYSPYNILCAMVLRDGFNAGLRGYDFLGDAEPWKKAWAASVRPHCWLFVFGRGPLACGVHFLKFRAAPIGRALRRALRRTG